MKIREMVVGKSISTELVLVNCSIRKTTAGKAYLDANFTDGVDSINCKLWDYKYSDCPQTNMVYTLNAAVGEYQGSKQLTINNMGPAESQDMTQFNKTYLNENPENVWKNLLRRIDSIENKNLRLIVATIYMRYQDILYTSTSAKGIHHTGLYGNMHHSLEVADYAKMIAEYANNINMYGLPVSIDLCIAGALLHDIGKARTYQVDGAVIRYTEAGNMLDHIGLGIQMLRDTEIAISQEHDNMGHFGNAFQLLAHIIASHHGQLEYGSPVTPGFAEAHIVSIADGISASLDTLLSANKKAEEEGKTMTDKIYTLNNKEHFLQKWVAEKLK